MTSLLKSIIIFIINSDKFFFHFIICFINPVSLMPFSTTGFIYFYGVLLINFYFFETNNQFISFQNFYRNIKIFHFFDIFSSFSSFWHIFIKFNSFLFGCKFYNKNFTNALWITQKSPSENRFCGL